MRIGQGVDVHAFSTTDDRRLRLGGVEIDHRGLAGHSDADVVLHAVVDALLGAAALGDIGAVFGTSDPQWAGAASSHFVEHTMALLAGRAFAVVNVDCTIVAARPRLAGHIPAMRRAVARLLRTDEGAVSVKATTTDGLGFTGRGEGIACLAVVLLTTVRPDTAGRADEAAPPTGGTAAGR